MSSYDEYKLGVGSDLEEWTETETRADERTTQTKADGGEAGRSELSISTALALPISSLYIDSAVRSAIPPDSGEFPLHVVSEKIKGIAFQLWPAAKVFAEFMTKMQTDESVAQPMILPHYHKATKAASTPSTVGSDVPASASSSSCIAHAATLTAAVTPVQPPLPPSRPDWWAGRRVLELGAGCGLNGILAAALGAEVVLTDMASVVDHLQLNIDRNYGPQPDEPQWTAVRAAIAPRISAKALGWDEPLPEGIHKGDFDVLLLSDCVYWEDLFEPLVHTLKSLATPATRIFLCQTPRRPKVEKRFYKLAEKHFKCSLIQLVAAKEESGEKRDVKLFEFTLRT